MSLGFWMRHAQLPGVHGVNTNPERGEHITVRAEVNHHLVLAILQDLVIGLLVFLHRLLHLDGVDLDAVQALRKLRVEVELVLVPNLPPL